MSDFDASFARLKAKTEEIQEERKRKWKFIQDESPELAAFLLEVNQAFGKPEKTWVVINEKRILGPKLMTDIDHWEEDIAWLQAQQQDDVSIIDADWFAEKVFDLKRKGQLTQEDARQAALRLIRGKQHD